MGATENQSKRGTVALTPTEKGALAFLALAWDTTESDIIRDRLKPAELVEEADRLRGKLKEAA